MQKHYVYLARCSDDTLYCGYTTDLAERERAHNEGKGAKYTRARLPVKVVYSEEFATRSQAQQREYAIKKLTRKEKEGLIEGEELL